MNDLFTCVTCSVAFKQADLQRDHYKTDWHRYNLKRRVADLPAVTSGDFADRVRIQKEQANAAEQPDEQTFCKLCAKHFTTANSFANHKQSKKHKELEAAAAAAAVAATNDTATQQEIGIKSDRSAKRAEQLLKLQREQEEQRQQQAAAAKVKQQQLSSESDMDSELTLEDANDGEDEADWEDVADEVADMDVYDEEATGIDLKTCLFCAHKSESMEAKYEHMAREHSFYVPDMEHVSDLAALLKFLGVKLGTYHVCLWCSSKCYRNLDAVQKHMADKGHQKMRFDGETLLEYADFYSYGDDDDDDDDEEEGENASVNVADYDMLNQSDLNSDSRRVSSVTVGGSPGGFKSVFEDENYELVLPSGVKIGHRSLFRYYKQSFGHRNIENKQRCNITVKDKYRAIANNGTYTPAEIKKQRKDLAYFQRWKAHWNAKLGWEANKLQKHFRRQDICF